MSIGVEVSGSCFGPFCRAGKSVPSSRKGRIDSPLLCRDDCFFFLYKYFIYFKLG